MTTPVIGPQAVVANVVIEQGATWRARFHWIEGGVSQSLEGITARFGVTRRFGSPPIFTVVSSTAGEIQLEPNGLVGVIDVVIPPEKTNLLRRNGKYDLVLFDQNDPKEILRLFEGTVTVHLAVVPTGSA